MSPSRHDPFTPNKARALPAALALLFSAAGAFAGEAGAPAALAAALAAPAASSPPRPADDGLDRVREKLHARLHHGKAVETGNPNHLHLSPTGRPAATSAAAAAARSAGGAAAVRKPPAQAGATASRSAAHPAHWSYEGATGPGAWGALHRDNALCAKGRRQSPIDIRGGLAVDLEPVRFDYQASRFAVVDDGHTVQVDIAPGNRIEVAGKRFELQQFHFHRPSEETVDGRRFEMSLHLVHKDEQGRLAVVAVLLDRGAAHPALQQVWNHLPLERHESNPARAPLELGALLPDDRRYYTYMGSLTTPPCSEGVQWIVMRQPVALSPEQIALFARIYPMNARPLQAAAGRRVLQSN